ncbi:MAG: alpha-amylase family glycosyl hydrolase [Enterocloster bolteae]
MGHFKDSTGLLRFVARSSQDTTGNGLGDIRGVISRLDYLKELGIDYIWLTRFLAPSQ